jgi:DNA polymerase-4
MLRARVAETGLICSVGVAATKHVAKIASTLSKPDGLLIVSEADTAAFLAALPVRRCGGGAEGRGDEGRGIRLVSDILAAPVLDRALGPAGGERIWQLAHGIDPRTVETERTEKSIGHEETFLTDVADRRCFAASFAACPTASRRVCGRLGGAGTVALKLRYADFTTLSRSLSLAEPSDVGQRIGDVAIGLFDALELSQPVRLIGVRAEKLRGGDGGSVPLWDDDAEWRRVDAALDDARERFGGGRSPGRASSARAVMWCAADEPAAPSHRVSFRLRWTCPISHSNSASSPHRSASQRLRRAAGRRRHAPHPRGSVVVGLRRRRG